MINAFYLLGYWWSENAKEASLILKIFESWSEICETTVNACEFIPGEYLAQALSQNYVVGYMSSYLPFP